MNDEPDPLTEAIDVLRATGRLVERFGDDVMLWLVDGEKPHSDEDLIAFAIRLGLMDGPAQLQ